MYELFFHLVKWVPFAERWLNKRKQEREFNELAIAKLVSIAERFSGFCLIQVEDYIESIKSGGEFGNDYIAPPELDLGEFDSFLNIDEWKELSTIVNFYKIGLAESANIPYSENLRYSLWLRFKACVNFGHALWELRERCHKDLPDVAERCGIENYGLRWDNVWSFYQTEKG